MFVGKRVRKLTTTLSAFWVALCATSLQAAPTPSPEYIYTSKDGSFVFDPHFASQNDWGFILSDAGAQKSSEHLLRRQRIGAFGKFEHDWTYQFLLEFANDKPEFRDAFIAYQGIENLYLVAGQFREYGDINQISSHLHLHFLERPTPTNVFQPIRNLGVGVNPYGDGWSYQLGVFGDSTGNAGNEDNGWGISTRLHTWLWHHPEQAQVLHLGGSFRYRDPSQDALRFSGRGDESALSDSLVATGPIGDVTHYEKGLLEAYFTDGPLSLLAQGQLVDVERDGADSVMFPSAVAHVTYTLTGEQRSYNTRPGTFGALIPSDPVTSGGAGAWEIGARFTTLDLTDQDISGGTLYTANLGLNWYPTWYTKIMLNYIYNETDGAVAKGRDPQYLLTRLQVNF